MTSDSFMIKRSSPSIFTSVPDHLPNSTRSPALSSSGTSLPLSSRAPGPTETTSPSWGFSLTVSGIMMPPFVLSSPSMRRITMRSCNGRNFMGIVSSMCAYAEAQIPCLRTPLVVERSLGGDDWHSLQESAKRLFLCRKNRDCREPGRMQGARVDEGGAQPSFPRSGKNYVVISLIGSFSRVGGEALVLSQGRKA